MEQANSTEQLGGLRTRGLYREFVSRSIRGSVYEVLTDLTASLTAGALAYEASGGDKSMTVIAALGALGTVGFGLRCIDNCSTSDMLSGVLISEHETQDNQ